MSKIQNTQDDSENEYRLHLLALEHRDPAAYRSKIQRLYALAKNGFQHRGRGVLFLIDDGELGLESYVPQESADQQFGKEVAHLCENYDPEKQWILVAITAGQIFPIIMEEHKRITRDVDQW